MAQRGLSPLRTTLRRPCLALQHCLVCWPLWHCSSLYICSLIIPFLFLLWVQHIAVVY